MEQLLSFAHEDIRYEDVPTGATFVGYDGMRKMAASAHRMSSDLTYDVLQRVGTPTGYAFEAVCRGTNTGTIGPLPGTGRPFAYRTVSIGEVSDGLVVSQRDYWDVAGLLGQLKAPG